MPEATEQGSHPNPKPATQSQAGASGNRSGGNRGGRSGGHKGTNRPQSQEHHQQRHGGSRRPPPGMVGEEHGRGSHHGRNHDGGGNQRHSDASQTSGKRSASEHRGNPSKGEGSSTRSHQYHPRSHSAARQAEGEQTPPRGKPPGHPQMAAKFLPPGDQKSQVQRTEVDQSAIAPSAPAVQPPEALENPPAELKYADPSIVEQKEAGAQLSVEEQQRHAQQLHMQMQQQQFIQQLALAQQLYFQQFQQQAVQRMAAMMATQQLQRQQQEESKQGEEEKLTVAIPEKEQPEENSTDRQEESAVSEMQAESLQPVTSSMASSMPESSQQMVNDEVSEQELARHLDMFMKEQGLVTGNDLAGRMADQLVFQGHETQQFFEPSSSHADESELVHPRYTQEHSIYSGTSEGYRVDPSLSVTAMGDVSAVSRTHPSQEQLFFGQPSHSTDTSLSMSHLVGVSGPPNSRPPVDNDFVAQLQGPHSYSATPPLQTTTSALFNGRSTNSPFDFSHDTTSRPFTGFSDHSSEHSWLGDGEPQFASLPSDPAGFESVGVGGGRPAARGTDAATQPDSRRQRKGGNHKPSPPTPSQVTLEVGGRMFFVFPVTFQSYPDSLLNQVLNGSNPVKLNERHAIAFDRDGFIFDILLSFCRTGRLAIPPSVSLASVLDEARFFRLDKYLYDPKFARPPRYHLTFKREMTCRLAMKNEPGCQMSCLFVVRGDDQLIVKEIKESSMRLLLDVTTETGEIKAKDYVLHDSQHPRTPLPTLRGGHIYSFHLGLPTDISRGVPLPTMEVVFQEMFVFADKEQLVNASTYGDKD